jgi:DNA-binding NtrC family response regulator
VGDATDALARLADLRPQVVLLDILMPGLSGLSALERIRTMSPHVEVIMVTGVGDEGIARQSLALGAYDYVAKPIDFEYLKRCIETCVLPHP